MHASQYANPLSSIWSITSLQHPYILHVKGVPWPNKLKFSHGHSKDAETELKDRGMTELISLHEKAFEELFIPSIDAILYFSPLSVLHILKKLSASILMLVNLCPPPNFF